MYTLNNVFAYGKKNNSSPKKVLASAFNWVRSG